MVDDGAINSNVAKLVFEEIFKNDVDPEAYVEEHQMKSVNDESAIREVIEKVLAENAQAVSDYRNGKEKALGALVGQTMKATKGKANPGVVNRILKELL
jgi:aspartyl-tRNA(Asn)/glutamyl-tRNA(Gln) amidotransferase subunit B